MIEGYRLDICDQCREMKEVRDTLDPYAKEIDNEEIEMTLCKNCYQDRCDDI